LFWSDHTAKGRLATGLSEDVEQFASQNQRQDYRSNPHPWVQPLALLVSSRGSQIEHHDDKHE
jgi:hypothetical protein